MELDIGPKTTVAVGDFGSLASVVHSALEGRKLWKSPVRLVFETSEANLRVFRNNFPELIPEEERKLVLPPVTIQAGDFPFRFTPRDYQLANFEKFRNLPAWANFSEPGTGKTKTTYDILSYNFVNDRIDAALILSYPKGVHRQWVEDQLPIHIWPGISFQAEFWNGKKAPVWKPGVKHVFSGNIEMLVHERSRAALNDFLKLHTGRFAFIIDESDCIKTQTSVRNVQARKLAEKYRPVMKGILTGTPIAKDLTDEWAQFFFLNPDIIGHKYKTSFMAQFCRMGGWENKSVVGHRNLEEFKRLTAPYTFRATKGELNLPEKLTDEVVFDLSDDQRKMIASIRENFMAHLPEEEGEKPAFTEANSGAIALLRMQQVSCGFTVVEDGSSVWLGENPRLKALTAVLDHLQGQKVIVWCRFVNDIELIARTLGERAVKIYGAVSTGDREKALREFMEGTQDVLVANPPSLGRGVDGLQKVCSYAIYYSNDFNAIGRWQSEDRIHRIGMKDVPPTYIDLIARGSPDRGILRNLRNKKSLSDLVLDDVKQLIKGE